MPQQDVNDRQDLVWFIIGIMLAGMFLGAWRIGRVQSPSWRETGRSEAAPQDRIDLLLAKARVNPWDIVPVLLEDLRSSNDGVRVSAHVLMRRLTNEGPTVADRGEWAEWWRVHSGKIRLTPLLVDRATFERMVGAFQQHEAETAR